MWHASLGVVFVVILSSSSRLVRFARVAIAQYQCGWFASVEASRSCCAHELTGNAAELSVSI